MAGPWYSLRLEDAYLLRREDVERLGVLTVGGVFIPVQLVGERQFIPLLPYCESEMRAWALGKEMLKYRDEVQPDGQDHP